MRVVFGGTFDPVHNGHLRMATELAQVLEVGHIDLMPCYLPVHKASVSASSADRERMLALATAEDPLLTIDSREIFNQGPSYTIESVRAIKQEIGREPLVLAMGGDSALQLDSWYCASELSTYVHLAVMERPGFQVDSKILESLGFCLSEGPASLSVRESGSAVVVRLNLLQISSTYIRRCVHEKKSIRYLVPDAVANYICDNELYQDPRAEVIPN